MKEMNAKGSSTPSVGNEKHVKEAYVKPQSEVVKMELEQPILSGSNGGGGGGYDDGGWY